jgi:hypothetical protein
MYLFHKTNLLSLVSILKSEYLKSYSLLKKDMFDLSKSNHYGNGLYTKNNFVYFSCVDKLFDSNILSRSVILYFKSELLYNKTFYVANLHSTSPEDLGEWTSSGVKMYKRKYNRYYTKYNYILKKLYKYSMTVNNGRAFEAFQQIAILNKCDLKNLVAIEFKNINASTKLINYINKYYSNIEIKITIAK